MTLLLGMDVHVPAVNAGIPFPSPEPGKLLAFHLESEGGLTALHTPYQSAREEWGGSQPGAVEKESKTKREGWEDNGNTDSNICFKKKWPGSILPEMASPWPPILSLTREPVILSPSRVKCTHVPWESALPWVTLLYLRRAHLLLDISRCSPPPAPALLTP